MLLSLPIAFTAWRADGGEAPKTGPAKVEGAVKEAELATITLQPEAEERLGIEIAPVEERAVERTRSFGGEIVIPPGGSVVVTAPLTGRLMPPETGGPIAGGGVRQGQTVFRLWPVVGSEQEVLSPADRLSRLRANVDIEAARVEVEGQVARARVAVDAARLKVDRARELQERNAGSARAYDDAKAEFDAAEATLKAATRRLEFLTATTVDPSTSVVPALSVESPIDGVLQQVFVTADQIVMSGAPLFSVANLERVWVRVPVYVGDMEKLRGDLAIVSLPGESPNLATRTARRIPAPATASASALTVDVYFELANPDGKLRPGQRVIATLTIGQTTTRLTVPWTAVMFDIHGGTWVYERVRPHVFTRRRVELERVSAGTAVLRRGIKVGGEVVSSGAAELYGTEFGVGK